jgi:hypothetical protein
MQTIFGDFSNGKAWEDFCQKCFKHKYEDYGYQPIPAIHEGDLGLEGYTRHGYAFQCYCPEVEYDTNGLHSAIVAKINNDLKKLVKNEKELEKYLASIKIKNWILVTPEYRKKDILKHCQKKAEEYRNKKLSILHKDFDILIHDQDTLIESANHILLLEDKPFHTLPESEPHESIIKTWKEQEIDFTNNALRKNEIRINNPNPAKIEKLTNLNVKEFLQGEDILRDWEGRFPQLYLRFLEIVDQFENEVEEACIVSEDSPNEIYKQIQESFKLRIDETFPRVAVTTRNYLKKYGMSKWILDCSIDFE